MLSTNELSPVVVNTLACVDCDWMYRLHYDLQTCINTTDYCHYETLYYTFLSLIKWYYELDIYYC